MKTILEFDGERHEMKPFKPMKVPSACEIYVERSTGFSEYSEPCGRPSKFVTPKARGSKVYCVCGIHRRMIDGMHKRNNTGLKCIPITMTKGL